MLEMMTANESLITTQLEVLSKYAIERTSTAWSLLLAVSHLEIISYFAEFL
jgi:hypothetical protein